MLWYEHKTQTLYTVSVYNNRRVTRSSGVARGGGGGGGHGGHGPPKLLVVNFPINLRCYVLLGCRVINVILAINIGDSAVLFNCWLQTCTLWLHMGLHCHMTKSYKAVDTLAPPNQNPGYATDAKIMKIKIRLHTRWLYLATINE